MGWDTSPPHRNAITREVPFPQLPSAWSATSPHAQNGALSSGRLGEAHAKWAVFTGCKYNQVNSHFHCIREGCQFSFLLKHQMTSHARKHMRRMLGKNFDRVPPSQGPPSLLDTETDEYLDYTGCSPGAMSSESSTMDRSCSSTPVGNESTAAGEPAAGGQRPAGERPAREGQGGPATFSPGPGPSSQGPALLGPS